MTFSPTWKSTTDLSFLCSGHGRGDEWDREHGKPETSVYHRWAAAGKRFYPSKECAVSDLRCLRESLTILRDRVHASVHVRLRIVVMGGNSQALWLGCDLDPTLAQCGGGARWIRHLDQRHRGAMGAGR